MRDNELKRQAKIFDGEHERFNAKRNLCNVLAIIVLIALLCCLFVIV